MMIRTSALIAGNEVIPRHLYSRFDIYILHLILGFIYSFLVFFFLALLWSTSILRQDLIWIVILFSYIALAHSASCIETQYAADEKFVTISYLGVLKTACRGGLSLILGIAYGTNGAIAAFALSELVILILRFRSIFSQLSLEQSNKNVTTSSFREKLLYFLGDRDFLIFVRDASLNNFVNTLIVDFDKIFISSMFGSSVLGVYQLAYAIFARVGEVIMIVGAVYLPRMVKSEFSDLRSLFQLRWWWPILALSFCLWFFFVNASRFLFDFWLVNYDPLIIDVFNILIMSFFPMGLLSLTGNFLLINNKQILNLYSKLISFFPLSIYIYFFANDLPEVSYYQLFSQSIILFLNFFFIFQAFSRDRI
ncbi:hypothetical protein N8829_00955 [bacterium]|nr:hypothetical protein [bacterium]